ncbi:hypothetical protein yc1106_08614 [Curvularia clavata]|uniref:O-methyltransferase C-terminal domain-containing protein n=1 Tax=Curvularia clavata TaxID=95742 RepID=A0A9Q9DWV2_CURCL|nr:hypothetical protein yc1106_08614 [Curvularia clavata]
MALAISSMENMHPLAGVYDYSWVAATTRDTEPDCALIVDVGGAKGHTIEVSPAPKMVGVDFFDEQPAKGALVYIIRRCLHDFSDEECFQILNHLSDAMARDSKLLVGETVLSNPPGRPTAMIDLLLSTIGGKERTIEGFNKVAERAGL